MIERLFNELEDNGVATFHDGALISANYDSDNLEACFLRRARLEKDSNKIKKYIKVIFFGISNLEIYRHSDRKYVPYFDGAFDTKHKDFWDHEGVNYFDYEDGFIVFDECMRFKCNNFEVISKFSD